jgi:hypothetical protein
MPTASLPQLVYVVRLWQSDLADQSTWRVSVQNPGTEERHIFATLEEFFAFVEEQTRSTNVTPENTLK